MKVKKKDCFLMGMLFLAAVVCLFPLLVIVSHSFMGAEEIDQAYGGLFTGTGKVDLHLIPAFFTLSQYREALFTSPEFYHLFLNNVLISIPVLAGMTVLSTTTGYGFARFDFPFRRLWLYLYLLAMLLPYQISLVPQFILMSRMGLSGTRWGIFLTGIFNPLFTYLMYHFASELPKEMMEAAALDGASEFTAFWRIALPNLRGGAAAVMVLDLVETWNMVEQPMVFLQDRQKYPLTLLLAELGRAETQKVFVYTLISLLPIMIVYVGLRNYLISGIEASCIRE